MNDTLCVHDLMDRGARHRLEVILAPTWPAAHCAGDRWAIL